MSSFDDIFVTCCTKRCHYDNSNTANPCAALSDIRRLSINGSTNTTTHKQTHKQEGIYHCSFVKANIHTVKHMAQPINVYKLQVSFDQNNLSSGWLRFNRSPFGMVDGDHPVYWRYCSSSCLKNLMCILVIHDDVIKWKDFPRYWPFVRGIHRSPVNSPHKGQWHGALMFSLICDWINGWVNDHEAGWFETLSRPLWCHCNVHHKTLRL